MTLPPLPDGGEARPRLEQRAVDGGVFVRHQIGRTRDHALKEAVGHGVLQSGIDLVVTSDSPADQRVN